MSRTCVSLAMDIFGPLKKTRTGKKYILVAMDYTTKWPEAFVLKQVFERLRAARLCIKKKKGSFSVNNCVYLGHVVGGGKIKPMECKIQAVREYKQPQIKKQVRAFLGLCGYYRRFIPSFSTIANPLTELTRKDRENIVKWDSHYELAFNSLKESSYPTPSIDDPGLGEPVCSSDRCLCHWPWICAQSKEPRWRRASCCLWVPEVTTQGTEVLSHRERGTSHCIWNQALPNLPGGNRVPGGNRS